ncbi:MAG: isoaspartyl peptidase/L-asparaginase [Planctomycetota bacterium]
MSGVVVVHGGAGVMRSLAGEQELAYREGLRAAAAAGRDALAQGADALEAAVVAVRSMEDSGVFNAGLGSCLDQDARYSLDASLMRGHDRAAGGVGAVTATYRAIDLCRSILDEGRHVLLVGPGADRRAQALGLPPLPDPPADKLATHAELQTKAQRVEDLGSVGRPDDDGAGDVGSDTVGAVVLDELGRCAAANSTGGLWLKLPGRVGDSALVGAGLFACDELGGAACTTGIGERMIRALTAKLACDALAQGASAQEAAEHAIADLERRFGPDSGGVIVVDGQGGVGAALNTRGMGRAVARVGDDAIPVAVWPDEGW